MIRILIKLMMLGGMGVGAYAGSEAITMAFQHERHYSHAHLGGAAILGVMAEKLLKAKWGKEEEDG